MTIFRAATHLADGANQLFDGWVDTLLDSGFEIEAVLGDDLSLDADVVFACGLLTSLRIQKGHDLAIIAAPIFAGETQAVYRSVVVASTDVAADALSQGRPLRLGINEYGSWSGWHGFKRYLRQNSSDPSVIGEHVLTGGHVASIEAVLNGSVDIASIDQSVWDARVGVDSRLKDLRILATTNDWPAPPILIRATLPEDVRTRLADAITSLPEVVPARSSDYQFMLFEAQEYPTWP